ncbi:uncharacterized protein LOC143281241 isoform X2 [Babylonia areolata]|uniref:uncharacterized protein LOC143281241 isoform X2 n=1 Tax=Babylonia areolata TaxID=304850 RepID=UPI003FD696F3
MSAPGDNDEVGFQGEGDGPRNLDEELARKVALQKQMLEQERQKEALGYQQSLLLQQQQQQQQQMSQPVPPPPPQMSQPVPPPAPPQMQPPPPQQAMQPPPPQPMQPPPQGMQPTPPHPPQQSDLMMKALQQQQMLEAEKQREAQQKLMQQQQLALLEAQRSEQQKRMMMEAQQQQQQQQQQQTSQPQMQQPGGPPPPPHLHPSVTGGAPQPPPGQPMVRPPQSHPGMPGSQPPQGPPPMHMGPPHSMPPQGQPPMSQAPQGPPQMSQAQQGGQMMGQGHMPPQQPPQSRPQGQPPQPPHMMFQPGQGPPQGQGPPPGQGPPGGPPTSFHSMGPPGSQPSMSQPSGMHPGMGHGPDRGFRDGGPPPNRDQGPGGPDRGSDMDGRNGGPMDRDMRREPMDQDMRRGPMDQDMRRGPMDQDMRRGGPMDQDMRRGPMDRGPPSMGMDQNRMDMERGGPDRGPQMSMDRGNDRGGPMDQGPMDHGGDRGPLGRMEPGRGQPLLQAPRGGPGPQGMEPRPPQSSGPGPREIRLPQALEKVLEFKSVRAQEMGLDDENPEESIENEGKEDKSPVEDEEDDFFPGDDEVTAVDEEEEEEKVTTAKPAGKESKSKKKKKKKKAKKNRFQDQKAKQNNKTPEKNPEEEVNIEYVQEQLELDPSDPNYHTFAKIFETFKITEVEKPKDKLEEKREADKLAEKVASKPQSMADGTMDSDDDMDESAGNEDEANKISKKKLKKMTRLSVAQLKQLVTRPDVVEMHDVTAKDPRLLVHLKATRNTVPVPRHWCYKRKYLQGKRGIEKQPFELPDFIRATGIEDMRAALQEKEEQKNLKAKMREKVRPKLGKIDIDYQKLHDAFFRFQTKPKMTIHGDLYYESKEFETRLKEKKPGNLTDDLRVALGMPVGANAERVPPPWLIAMQRYGPPPSYPNLKIPGLNAPIPEGCSFGYHAGGWGKPPVDEMGRPLYGDVFGTQGGDAQEAAEEEEVDKSHWGELESESESEEESEEEEEEKDESGLVTPAEGLVTPSGLTSIPVGVETPDMIELRKRRIEDAMDQGGDTPALYTVLPEKKTSVGGAMMGSAHIYDMAGVQPGKKGAEKGGAAEGVEVTLNPEELDLDTAAMQAKYDETVREQQSQLEKEDLSDMVAAHAAKQRKRKKQQADSGKSSKRYKDFKF